MRKLILVIFVLLPSTLLASGECSKIQNHLGAYRILSSSCPGKFGDISMIDRTFSGSGLALYRIVNSSNSSLPLPVIGVVIREDSSICTSYESTLLIKTDSGAEIELNDLDLLIKFKGCQALFSKI